jgi:alpha-beta hydrolase superfamily lysophospholipase
MSDTNYTEIDFDSVGAKLRGRLYRSGNSNAPIVVMAHGFTATAHMSLYKFAERLAEHGNHTLVYDHRNLGLSDGALVTQSTSGFKSADIATQSAPR